MRRFASVFAFVAVLAFASSSYAGSIYLDSSFTVTGGTASDVEFTFGSATGVSSAVVTSSSGVGSTSVNIVPISALSETIVVVDFGTASAAGSVDLTIDSTVPLTAYELTGLTGGVTASTLQVNVVPEPTSLALLGIGMTGFFTYRRFFKRSAKAAA
jgi:hypothetical protein